MTQENKIKVCRIEEETFKELIEAVKHCTSKDDARPVLRYIRVQATETAVIFSALDGFRCGRAIATRQNPIGADCFTCYILPFAFKPLKGMPSDVVIEYDGKMYPDAKREGETFKGFISILTTGISKDHPAFYECCEFLKISPESEQAQRLIKGLGYKVEYKELKACDYGAPTIRKRFYLIARNDGLPIVFPEPTHGKGKKPYKTAAECIDFSLPCPSIFGRKKDLAVNTQKRIAKGLDKFVIKSASPFIMSNNTGNAPHGLNEPVPTVTTGVRNFVCMPYLSKYFSGERQAGASIKQPLPTVTGIDHNYLMASHLCILRNHIDCKSVTEPIPTITSKASHEALIKTYLTKIDGVKGLGNWCHVRNLLNNYAGYNIAEDEILILEINGEQYFISDIGMRMLKPQELMLAQGFPFDYVLDIETYIGKKYSVAKQIERMGNAVCPPVATALIRANCAEMIVARRVLPTMAMLNKEFNRTLERASRRCV